MSNSRSIDWSFHGMRQMEHRLMSSQVKEETRLPLQALLGIGAFSPEH